MFKPDEIHQLTKHWRYFWSDASKAHASSELLSRNRPQPLKIRRDPLITFCRMLSVEVILRRVESGNFIIPHDSGTDKTTIDKLLARFPLNPVYILNDPDTGSFPATILAGNEQIKAIIDFFNGDPIKYNFLTDTDSVGKRSIDFTIDLMRRILDTNVPIVSITSKLDSMDIIEYLSGKIK